MTGPTLSMEQLIKLTTIVTCTECGLDHAPARTCAETRQAHIIDKLPVDTRLYGYCNGYFGRDSYGEKIVVASGRYGDQNWVVVINADFMKDPQKGPQWNLMFASGFPLELVDEWLVKESDE